MLSRARTDEAAHTKLQTTISSQVAHMHRLISDLLDGSRISTGKLRLERRIVDLSDILDLAIETLPAGDGCAAPSIQHLMPSGPIKVLGDAARLMQVLGNLLENACQVHARRRRDFAGKRR